VNATATKRTPTAPNGSKTSAALSSNGASPHVVVPPPHCEFRKEKSSRAAKAKHRSAKPKAAKALTMVFGWGGSRGVEGGRRAACSWWREELMCNVLLVGFKAAWQELCIVGLV
jgi:hypothetical protein